MVKRAADLLQSGAIMGKVLQPHYSHVPYNLQFMMDYNLQGMNFVHLSRCLFRRRQQHSSHSTPSSQVTSFDDGGGDEANRLYYENQLPPELVSPATRRSTTELEIDAVAADILNTNQELRLQSQSTLEDANQSIFKNNKNFM